MISNSEKIKKFGNDRRIKAVGRVISPVYNPGAKKVQNTKAVFDEASRTSLEYINAKYCKTTNRKVVITVDSNLNTNTTVI